MFSVREKAAKSGTIFSKSFLRLSSPPKIRETAVSQRHAFSAGHSGTQTALRLQRDANHAASAAEVRKSYSPKYARIFSILTDCSTWKGHRESQCPQPTQSEAFFSRLA